MSVTFADQVLGEKRLAILDAIIAHEEATGVRPAWHEIAQATGLDNPKLEHLLHALRHQGFIRFTRKPRSLTLTDAGRIALNALRSSGADVGERPDA